jgi:cytolysin (calcineurin-like family phosphatase)
MIRIRKPLFETAAGLTGGPLAVLALMSLAAFTLTPARGQELSGETAKASAQTTDVTFAFTSDVHVSFNGHDDHQGILDMVNTGRVPAINSLLIGNETMTKAGLGYIAMHSDACLGQGFSMVKDLCNQIQLVRKLNHLPHNRWDSGSHTLNGHAFTMASGGRGIGTPKGLLVGGDLTDCGGGSNDVTVGIHSENCDVNYGNGTPGAQLSIFKQLFDLSQGYTAYPLGGIAVIQGLKNPDDDTPLRFPIYPGLGNHDLGFDQSGQMMEYIRSWNPGQQYPRHVTSNDNYSGVYSLDWGKVHVINAGVFAGSNNQSGATGGSNYPYDQNVMDWIARDLQTYASDGRPVILVQHFGFDSYSWSSNWYWGDSSRDGASNLWPLLAPYNVVGIFHGHNHGRSFYQFQPGELYSNGVATVPGNAPYDIFDSGPGYGQEFVVARITDKSMDAQAATSGADYDNSSANPSGTVPFDLYFNKRLVGTPTSGTSGLVDVGDSIATSAVYDGSRYLIGANASGHFTVRKATGGQPVVSTGTFAVLPRFLTSYSVGKLAYVLVSDGRSVVSYRMNANLDLQKQWSQSAPLHSMVPLTSAAGLPYLLVDELVGGDSLSDLFENAPPVRLQYYQLSTTGMVLAGHSMDLGGTYARSAQMYAFPTADSGFTVVRYVPTGGAEFYHGWVDIWGNTVLALKSRETWVADSVYADPTLARPNVLIQPVTLADKTTAFLVKSPSCQHYTASGTCDHWESYNSPYFVRTLTQDGTGTQISWRGKLPGHLDMGAMFFLPLDPVNGAPVVGMYTALGILSTITVQD